MRARGVRLAAAVLASWLAMNASAAEPAVIESGAPSGKLDEACREAGLAALRDDLELGQ